MPLLRCQTTWPDGLVNHNACPSWADLGAECHCSCHGDKRSSATDGAEPISPTEGNEGNYVGDWSVSLLEVAGWRMVRFQIKTRPAGTCDWDMWLEAPK